MAFKRHSVSDWEDSYFGGYTRVLLDYPQIDSPWKIDVEFPKTLTDDLSYYTRKKLTSIFQLRIKEYDLFNAFMVDAKIKEVKNFLGRKQKYLVPTKSAIKSCVSYIIERDTELTNLFDYFKDTLSEVEFMYPVDDPGKDKSSKSEGEDEGDGKKDNQKATATEKKQAKDLLEEITMKKSGKVPSGSTNMLTGKYAKEAVFKLMKPFSIPTKYRSEEIITANNLVRLLDVNFDPHSDKIDNLRFGKLDVAKIATVPAGNRHIYYTIEENQTTKPFSVCFLGDESGSMGGITPGYTNPASVQHSLMKTLYKAFSQIVPSSKIFIYGHSGHYHPEIRVYHDPYNQMFETTIERQRENEFLENYDGPVIETIYKKVRSITSDNILFISVSDGAPSGHGYGGHDAINDMKRIIEKCKRDGFVTIGIGIRNPYVKEIYNYNCVINDMTVVAKRVSTLINSVVKTEFKDE